jgi:hypothetical protein
MQKAFSLVLAAVLLWSTLRVGLAQGPTQDTTQDWGKVTSLTGSDRVVVEPHRGSGNTVEGWFLSADPRAITVETKLRKATIEKSYVRRVSLVEHRDGYQGAGAWVLLGGFGTSLLLSFKVMLESGVNLPIAAPKQPAA